MAVRLDTLISLGSQTFISTFAFTVNEPKPVILMPWVGSSVNVCSSSSGYTHLHNPCLVVLTSHQHVSDTTHLHSSFSPM